jgi:hypothetical protein
LFELGSGLVDLAVGIAVSIFVVVVGAIIMIAIYPTNPIMAIVCVVLVIVAALWIARGLLFLMFIFGKR